MTSHEILIEKAKILAGSDLIPPAFQKNPSNCYLAVELADQLGLSPLMVMQNIFMIHGKPGLSSSFIIALLKKNAEFEFGDFEFSEDRTQCRYFALKGDRRIEGPWVSIEMATREGWSTKAGSKWKTMPDLMLRYRAATFFCRTCTPHLLMGFQTEDEIKDVGQPQQVQRKIQDLIAPEVVE